MHIIPQSYMRALGVYIPVYLVPAILVHRWDLRPGLGLTPSFAFWSTGVVQEIGTRQQGRYAGSLQKSICICVWGFLLMVPPSAVGVPALVRIMPSLRLW